MNRIQENIPMSNDDEQQQTILKNSKCFVGAAIAPPSDIHTRKQTVIKFAVSHSQKSLSPINIYFGCC